MKKIGYTSLAGLIVALIGILSPILWDLYKNRSFLQMQVASNSTLIEKSSSLDKLVVTYDGTPITTLNKISLILINSGRTPILKKDVVTLPLVKFPPETRVLDVSMDRCSPENLGVLPKILENQTCVQLDFALLNAGDYCQFSVLLSGDSMPIRTEVRIAGVKDMPIIDNSSKEREPAKPVSWMVLPVGAFTALLIFLMFTSFHEYSKERKMRTQLNNGTFTMPPPRTPKSLLERLDTMLSFTMKPEREILRDFLRSLPQEEDLNDVQLAQFESKLSLVLDGMFRNAPLVVFFIIFSTIGAIYVGVSLF